MGVQAFQRETGREYLVHFLERCAEALSKREIVNEELRPDGRYRVTEDWPSHDAYFEVKEHRATLEAMRLTRPQSRC
jgi:hypothetical protein